MAYSKTNWQDLPNTTTPITATRLNNMETGIENNDKRLNGTSVSGDMVVSSIRTKNLFGNYVVLYGWLDNNNLSIHNASNERLAFIPCKSNTTYTVSRNTITTRFRVGDYSSIPAMTSTQTYYTPGGWTKNDSASSITYTTSSSAKYLIIEYANVNNDNATTISNCLSSMQVEEGSTATTYNSYQSLNNKENYSLIEEVIGTWVDGKPLYRRVMNAGTIITTNTSIGNIDNVDTLVSIRGSAYSSQFSQYYGIPNTHSEIAKYYINLFKAGNGIIIRYGSEFTNGLSKVIAIVEYTKTTD